MERRYREPRYHLLSPVHLRVLQLVILCYDRKLKTVHCPKVSYSASLVIISFTPNLDLLFNSRRIWFAQSSMSLMLLNRASNGGDGYSIGKQKSIWSVVLPLYLALVYDL